ncbi:ribonuclease HII [Candidatus Peribacteria bacterium]|nr:ribonuclease HII [Candidatus Peribacteria bacterium]
MVNTIEPSNHLTIRKIFTAIDSATTIAGIDEVGRGAVAGPVVACACVIATPLFRRRRSFSCWSPFEKKADDDVLIADSKLLSPHEREISSAWIRSACAFGVGAVSAFVIDKRGILYSTNQAMLLALEDLRSKTSVQSLLVDGRDRFHFPLPHQSIIRGDQSEPAIAAASIVAKVFRDGLMREYAKDFPLFGFEHHKGYGAPVHLAAISEHGPCTLHRRSFLRAHLENQTLPIVHNF